MDAGEPSENRDELAGELVKTVGELAAELHPGQASAPAVTLDTSLDRDLGLDSLTRVELLARIGKRFGASLPERVFADAQTPRDLLRAVLVARGASDAGALAQIAPVALGHAEAAPRTAGTLVDVLDWHVNAHPDRPHIRLYSDEDEGEAITYRQLRDGAEAVAAGLQNVGLAPGEPVAIMLPTGREYFFTFLGVLLAGGVPAPVYPPASRTRIEEHLRRHRAILANCAAATLVTTAEAKPFGGLIRSQVDTLRRLATPEELAAAGGALVRPGIGAQNTAFLQYTSGSTGNPKGVVLTHASLLANVRAMGEAVEVHARDVFVSWLPLYHDMGLIGAWFGSLCHAMLLVIMPPLSFMARPQRWLRAIHRHRGTLSAAPNFAYELCLRRLDDQDLNGLDLSSWRAAFNGAEPVSPDTIERFCERFGRYGFRRETMMPVFGLAENSVGLAFPPLDRGPLVDGVQREPFMSQGRAVAATDADDAALQFVACGRPLPGHEIRVVDPSGREAPERQEGRLQFRGPSSCSGYFRNPEATRRLFDGEWLDSGDRAYIAAGDLYATGRSKDIIIRAGRNIHPQEIEEAVGDVPGIRKGSVAAFGSPDPESGTERLVVLAETRKRDPEALEELRGSITALAAELAGAPPDDVVLAPPGAVLKTSSGKVRRAASRELYESGRIGERPRSGVRQILRFAGAGIVPALRRTRRAVGEALYAAGAWTLLGGLFPALWLVVALLPKLRWRWTFLHAVARSMAWVLRIPLSVQGLERLPRDRPYLLVSNHASYLDGYVLLGALPAPVSFVAKAELLRSLTLRVFLRRLGTEFVERFDKQKGLEDAQRISRAARSGRPLFLFAEGTFTRVPGLLPFHMGAFVAAAEAGVPVVPVAIRGTRSMLRAESWFPRRGSVTVTFGVPIAPSPPEAPEAPDAWTVAVRLRNATREHILRYCGEPDLSHEKSPI